MSARSSAAPLPLPPIAPRRLSLTRLHGAVRVDPYSWMKGYDNPELLAYLEAENAYAEAMTLPIRELQDTLYREMLARLPADDASVPAWNGGSLYYRRQVAGKPYLLHCRRRRGREEEELLLDENELAAGHSYFRLGVFSVCPHGRLLLYGVDTSGAESFVLAIKDLRTGRILPDRLARNGGSAAWAADGRTLFYDQLDDSFRRARLLRHTLGEDPACDTVVYEEQDPAYHLSVGKSESGAFLLVVLASRSTAEVRILPAAEPTAELRTVLPRTPGIEASLSHEGETFYILTHEDAPNGRLMAVPVADPRRSAWREVVPHRDEVVLEDIRAFAGSLVLQERERGEPRLRVLDTATGEVRAVGLPPGAATLYPEENLDFRSRRFRFGCSSLTVPYSVYDCALRGGSLTLRKRTAVPGGYDPLLYCAERLSARASDGTQVPLSLVYRRDLRRVGNGGNPLLLHGYGAYGIPLDPAFSPLRLSLLDRGWIVALAHVRGGGDLGRAWHDAGRRGSKANSVTDFLACAEHLVAAGYTAPDRLAAAGESAGGIVLGAAANRRPDLFAVLLAQVPFVDVVNTLLDPDLPLSAAEWEELGDPRDPRACADLLAYSPYDNVVPRDYPALVVTAALNDARVPCWEAAKWVARLRANQLGRGPLLLRTDLSAGHGGPSDRFASLAETAFLYAFLLDRLARTAARPSD